MGSYGRPESKMTGKGGNLDTDKHREDHVKTQREDGHLKSKQRGFRKNQPTNILILGF